MPHYKSVYSCFIPQDASARMECYLSKQKWGPGSADPHTAAIKMVNKLAEDMEGDPTQEQLTRKTRAEMIRTEEGRIVKHLDEQWAIAEKEYKEFEALKKKAAEEAMADQMMYDGEAIARAKGTI